MHTKFQKTIFYWVIIIRQTMKILFIKGECSIPQLACSPQNTQFKSVFSIIQKHWTKSVFSLLLVRAQTDDCFRLDLSILNVHSSRNMSLDLHCISKCAASNLLSFSPWFGLLGSVPQSDKKSFYQHQIYSSSTFYIVSSFFHYQHLGEFLGWCLLKKMLYKRSVFHCTMLQKIVWVVSSS